MKTIKLSAAVLIFLTAFTTARSQNSVGFDAGLKEAKSSGKMVLLDVYSDSDNWSKKMDAEVLSTERVKSALSGIVFIRLNIDQSGKYNYNGKSYSTSELAKLFGGTGYPSFSFMNPDGSIIKFKYNGDEVINISGFISEEDFTEMIDFFKSGNYKSTDLSTIFTN
ncbi:MAG TPA: thioredoxin family protein [Ignavibacteria bacterium]|mgnify:CR=1 FL=1|nr:hypothetical protein [Bacteroidota bacterium]HRI84270.1 thioredoxin family protein [Ignavibacteria bacterium]HRK00328.1 thioredoxin family protein [Ignavibacteria bacterium]